MVALPCSTVARRSASMLAWAVWMGVLLTGFVHAQSNGRARFNGDVNDDDVMIDKLKDIWARNRQAHLQRFPSPGRPHKQDVNRKIEFAVTPQDERYYHPPAPSLRNPSPSHSDLLSFLEPDLNLQPQLDYPGDLLLYQDEDAQYPPEYTGQYRPQYRPQELHRPSYLKHQDLRYISGLYPSGLDDQQLLREKNQDEEEEEGEEGLEERVQDIRKLADDAFTSDESQMMMKKGEAEKEEKEEKDAENKDKEVSGDSDVRTFTSTKAATSQPETLYYMNLRHEPVIAMHKAPISGTHESQLSDIYFTGLLAGCTAVAVCAVVGAGICWYKLNKSHRAAQDAEYPAYGVTGPNKDLSPSDDRKLAQSAHMYHYQYQKQQMIALEKPTGGERHGSTSDVDSDEGCEDNECPVYECPGLAPTGEMEVKNPLFHDDLTPATPSIRKGNDQDHDCHEEEKSNK